MVDPDKDIITAMLYKTNRGTVGIPGGGISLMGVVITGPIKRAVIAGSYTPLYTARVVACSRSEFRSGISDEPVREQVSPLAVAAAGGPAGGRGGALLTGNGLMDGKKRA